MSFIRPTGWGLCIPLELVREHGDWIVEAELALFEPDCWMNWHYQPHAQDASRFIPMLWSPASYQTQGLTSVLSAHPDATWLLWNEPDHRLQANMTPRQAFDATLDFLRAQWDLGHEFQWAAPGVQLCNLDWLTEYVRLLRRHGVSRPSYWHIHSYSSNTLDTFRAGWRAWERWYTQWGVETPVVLSEACAEARLLDQQRLVMDECRQLLSRERVVGVMWFASHLGSIGWTDYPLATVDPLSRTVGLTDLGRHWLDLKR